MDFSVRLSHRLKEPLIEFDVLRESAYREAVTKPSYGMAATATGLWQKLPRLLSQGSREARQPWAVCRNRFALMLPESGLDPSFLKSMLLGRKANVCAASS
jgi:hypothetical protein